MLKVALSSALDVIFADKIPNIKDDEDEKWLVGADILEMARWRRYISHMISLQWLIYTAAFKDPNAEPRGSLHAKFFRDWRKTFQSSEPIIRKKLKKQLEFWYAKHPPSKRGPFNKDDCNFAGGPDCEQLKIYHDDDDDDDDDDAQPPAGHDEGGFGN